MIRGLAKAQLDRLYSHAIAAQRWPELGLVDSAAAQLLDIVGGSDRYRTINTRAEPLVVLRSRALDARALSFLADAPTALVINVGAGLNTRFHRLSQQLDWPRFHWLELNTPALAQAQQSYFPVTDNYLCRAVTAQQLASVVHQTLRQWQGPALIIAESPATWLSACQWRQLLIAGSAAPQMARRDIIYDYLSPLARWRCYGWGAPLARLYPRAHFANPAVPAPWRLLHRVAVKLPSAHRMWGHWQAAHLSKTQVLRLKGTSIN